LLNAGDFTSPEASPLLWPAVSPSGNVVADSGAIGVLPGAGRVSGDVGGSIGAGRLRSWHVLTRNISIATELTTDASVIKGVQNAFQRSRRRSSLSSSRFFFGDGGFTDPQSGPETTLAPASVLIYYERAAKSNRDV
jgi:hypothetical protein